ncbi:MULTISPECIES: sensor histidine kinase [Streptosporangium]|uniref:histidine kinase n=1 Tax=Streptosporangium brasiliense TaxID=47480 RepID=A0ABT9REQ0_9ACTN|nr:sensor histidine kinase [Streptosporangium brasiliense]MDP9867735.1 signal transduction histidine kinase [Streptosporangium brasiliense]
MDDLDVDGSLLLRRWSRGQLVALDALAGTVYVIAFLLSAIARPAAGTQLWAQCLLPAGIGAALAVRRLWPLPVFGLVLGASLVSFSLGLAHDGFAAAAFALYPVALTRPRRRWEPTVAIGVCGAAAFLMLSLAGSPTPAGWARPLGALVAGAAFLGCTWTVGRAVRERRAYAARSAEQLADRAVTEERLRIARELHDVVAHSMSLIAVKAGIANHVAEARPEEARDALRVIEATSRGALTEMRHLLGVMRSGPGAAPDTVSGLSPAPGLDGLPELAGRAAMAGVRVDLDVTAAALPEGVGLSVYRIVQEALTNVVRHAAPARCRVAVEADGREVRVEVTDDGPGHRVLPGRQGHGLIGMRERVIMYGGTFTAGRRPEGGFGVSARLPYGEDG